MARLSRRGAQVAELSLLEGAHAACSPRLLEAVVPAVARWADSYVAPPECPPDCCEVLVADDEAAATAAEGLLQVASACLSRFPGEVQLQRVTIEQLLTVLVRGSRVGLGFF